MKTAEARAFDSASREKPEDSLGIKLKLVAGVGPRLIMAKDSM